MLEDSRCLTSIEQFFSLGKDQIENQAISLIFLRFDDLYSSY
jgi:hypothetical protein